MSRKIYNNLFSIASFAYCLLSFFFLGGLVSDLQRLLPLDSGNDLYTVKHPDVPAAVLYHVRPFQPKDEEHVYALAADAYERSIDTPMGLGYHLSKSGVTGLFEKRLVTHLVSRKFSES
jgi:hypothetical protein